MFQEDQNQDITIDELRIVRHPRGWALMVDDIDEPAWVIANKDRAVEWARDAADHHEAKLEVIE